VLDSVDEKRKGFLVECMEALTAAGPVSEATFVRHLVETLLSLTTLGHCVIVGRGAAQILPKENTLRVRLVGAKEDRIEATRRRLNVPLSEAAQWVEKTDRERTAFVREHFGKDPADATCYDLVLNTSRWSVAECADFIVQAEKALEKT
jgi:cytidylate kinase